MLSIIFLLILIMFCIVYYYERKIRYYIRIADTQENIIKRLNCEKDMYTSYNSILMGHIHKMFIGNRND